MDQLNRIWGGVRVFSALRIPALFLTVAGIAIGCMETPTRTPSSESEAGLATAAEVAGLPIITQQPELQEATVGYTVTFTVAATSTTPLTYQWYYKENVINAFFESIPGATEASYSKLVHYADTGDYFRCVVSNASGSVTSDAAQARVKMITLQAEDAAILTGAEVGSRYSGYSGTGYVGFPHSSGSSVQWNITMRRAGTYPMVFRYSNKSATTVLADVVINGKTYATDLAFPPTGSWGNWSTVTYDQGYTTGSRRIVLLVKTAVGLNLDMLTIE
jgi:hypothetical protein